MKKPVVYYGNPLLRKKAQPVVEITAELRAFIADMEETRKSYHGLGISAPQVGKSLAIFIASPPTGYEEDNLLQEPPRVYINPKLSDPSDETWIHNEGCLSIPKIYGDVERPVEITITAQDIDGKEFTEKLTGWAARVIMHENDHLNGVLFIDRLSIHDRNAIETKLKQLKKLHK